MQHRSNRPSSVEVLTLGCRGAGPGFRQNLNVILQDSQFLGDGGSAGFTWFTYNRAAVKAAGDDLLHETAEPFDVRLARSDLVRLLQTVASLTTTDDLF